VRANVRSPTTAGLIRKWRKPGDFSSPATHRPCGFRVTSTSHGPPRH
jgi:hypothetical protein